MNEETKLLLRYVRQEFTKREMVTVEEAENTNHDISGIALQAVSDTYASAAQFVQELLDND